jgi:heat shock protein HtpX
MIIQMAISRSREYQADATGAGFVGKSDGLADALEKLGAYSEKLPMAASPATAHMFIVNPLSGRSLMSLFSTHPPLADRIARLRGSRPTNNDIFPSGPQKTDKMTEGRAFWDSLSNKD